MPDLNVVSFGVACSVAFFVSILGGLSGFGVGLALPVFLVPVVGIANVVPVMAVAMIFNNGSRVIAFGQQIQWSNAKRILAVGLPACIAGAYSYTLLPTRWIALILGSFLLLSVPLRRILKNANLHLNHSQEVFAGAIFGYLNGGLTGTGILLVSILMSAGVTGAALVASDAIVSVVMGVSKILIFGGFAGLDAKLAIIGVLVGLFTVPGAFVARWLLKQMPAGVHAWLMEAIVIIGAVVMIWRVK
jgi:uncharacterized membrane protein YfcA